MSGLTSYPRTSGPAPDEIVPAAAYANVPEPLRTKLIQKMAAHRRGFSQQLPGMDFLIPSYIEPNKFNQFSRADDEGRLFPEPGAIAGDMPNNTSHLHSTLDANDPDIAPLMKDINTFSGVVEKATRLSDDEMVWRFIGANYAMNDHGSAYDKYYANRLAGNFWGVGSIPTTEEEWRNTCAIPGIWNGDGGYIACRIGDLPQDVREVFRAGLIGTVAPQPSMVNGHYFQGGARQLFLDSNRMKIYEKYFSTLTIHRSNWNR